MPLLRSLSLLRGGRAATTMPLLRSWSGRFVWLRAERPTSGLEWMRDGASCLHSITLGPVPLRPSVRPATNRLRFSWLACLSKRSIVPFLKGMKTNLFISCLLLGLGVAQRVFPMAGELTEPSLAFPKDFPQSASTNILAALRASDWKFLGGHFVNGSSTLEYGGDAQALNRFLERLVKCPGVVLYVGFETESIPIAYDWRVSHSARQPGMFTVSLNLKSSRIAWEQVGIPGGKGPPLQQFK